MRPLLGLSAAPLLVDIPATAGELDLPAALTPPAPAAAVPGTPGAGAPAPAAAPAGAEASGALLLAAVAAPPAAPPASAAAPAADAVRGDKGRCHGRGCPPLEGEGDRGAAAAPVAVVGEVRRGTVETVGRAAAPEAADAAAAPAGPGEPWRGAALCC